MPPFGVSLFEVAVSAALFAIPATAGSWRGLAWRAAIAAALTLAAFAVVTEGRMSFVAPGGDANIGAGIVIYFAIAIFGAGFAARALSLLARKLGHPRPWSLWIEGALFVGFPHLVRAYFGA